MNTQHVNGHRVFRSKITGLMWKKAGTTWHSALTHNPVCLMYWLISGTEDCPGGHNVMSNFLFCHPIVCRGRRPISYFWSVYRWFSFYESHDLTMRALCITGKWLFSPGAESRVIQKDKARDCLRKFTREAAQFPLRDTNTYIHIYIPRVVWACTFVRALCDLSSQVFDAGQFDHPSLGRGRGRQVLVFFLILLLVLLFPRSLPASQWTHRLLAHLSECAYSTNNS